MQAPKKTRKTYTAQYKLQVVKLAEEIGNCAAGRECKVSEKNIREWRGMKAMLETMPKNAKSLPRPGRPPKWPELETKLHEWVLAERKEGHAISTVLIRVKARELARQGNLLDFKGGCGWCYNFMRRKKLSVRAKTTLGQKLPDDWEEKVRSFQLYVREVVKTNNIGEDHIYNMDEVPMYFDMPQNRTVDTKGAKSVYIKTTGHEKTHFTVVLCCSATGKKMNPMLIFKRVTIPKEEFPFGVIVKCNPKGWMNENVMLQWLEGIFPDDNEIKLLCMDSMKSHKSDSVLEDCWEREISVAIIPGGLTKKIQPLDLTINRSFKHHVRLCWEKWMTNGLKTFTKTGNMRKASFAEVATWVILAWEAVPTSTIQKAFQVAGIIPKPSKEVLSVLPGSSACALDLPSTSSGTTASAQPSACRGANSQSETEESEVDEEELPLDLDLASYFHSDTEESEFEGFPESEADKEFSQYFCSDSDDSEFLGFDLP